MTRNNSTKSWLLILILPLMLAGPIAAGVLYEVTRKPARILLLTAIYEVLVVLGGFVIKIWDELQKRWIHRIADWIDTRVQSVLSRYRKRYLQHVYYRHRDLDVKGLSTQGPYTLELEDIFVDLSILPQSAHQASSDLLRAIPEVLLTGQHSIWEYLKLKPTAPKTGLLSVLLSSGKSAPARLRRMTKSKLRSGQRIAILGAPGSGKTTLVKHMTLALTGFGSRDESLGLPTKLPILLFLRDHAEGIKTTPTLTLVQAIQDSLAKFDGPAGSDRFFEAVLRKGKCIVMLDGLDEVGDPEIRRGVVAWVERQMISYAKNSFVITSRPFGYRSNPPAGVAVLEVCPFTVKKIQRFLNSWYLANEIRSAQKDDPGVRMEAQRGAKDLLKRIRNTPTLSALAVNPLLLTMIATVHRYRSNLPARRVELYREICEVFFGKRKHAQGAVLDLTPSQKQTVLQSLAYEMMSQTLRQISLTDAARAIKEPLAMVDPNILPQDFLRSVENSSGILLERENEIYSFAHLTFQEFLASVHIYEDQLVQDLTTKVNSSWWHETIRLYCAQSNATPIIRACLSMSKPSAVALVLATECLHEAHQVEPEVRTRLETILDAGVEDSDAEWQHTVAEALLGLRLRRLVRLDEDTFLDTSLISNAEYQVFIDNEMGVGKYPQPYHWLENRFSRGSGHNPVLGTRAKEAVKFCGWLTQRESESDWIYRLPRMEELTTEILNQYTPSVMSTNVGIWRASGKTEECVWLTRFVPNPHNADLKRSFDEDLAVAISRKSGSKDVPRLNEALEAALSKAGKIRRHQNFDFDWLVAYSLSLLSDGSLSDNIQTRLNAIWAFSRSAVSSNISDAVNYLRNLGEALERARDLELAGISNPQERKESFDSICRSIRSQAAVLAFALSSHADLLAAYGDPILDIYVDFAHLTEQLESQPSYGGILIVKERTKEHGII